jgi:hypothetical protein
MYFSVSLYGKMALVAAKAFRLEVYFKKKGVSRQGGKF